MVRLTIRRYASIHLRRTNIRTFSNERATINSRMLQRASLKNIIAILIIFILQSSSLIEAQAIEPDRPLAAKSQPTLVRRPREHLEPGASSPSLTQTGNSPQQKSPTSQASQPRRRDTIVKKFLKETNPQKEEDKLKVFGLIRGTRELLSPSPLNSLYNYINKGPETKKQKQQEVISQQTTMPKLHATNYHQQLAIIKPHPHRDHGNGAIALGRENELMMRPHLDSNRFVAPFLLNSNGNELAASNMIGVPPMFEQSLNSNRHEQDLVNLYPETHLLNAERETPDFENVQALNNFNQHRGTVEDVYVQRNPDHNRRPYVYSRQIHENPATSIETGPQTSTNPLDNQKEIKKSSPPVPQLNRTPSPQEEKQQNRERLLSNAQLFSLIDELKEFNSRQARKIQSSGVVPPSNRQVYPKYDKDSEHSSSLAMSKVDDSQEAQSNAPNEDIDYDQENQDNQRPVAQATGDNGRMSANELAKFAKFLMTKEGANLKFQLGLEKESPDDGDEEDERDSLLETKTKQQTARPKKAVKKHLQELEEKNSKAAEQMDKLIDNVSDKTREIEHIGHNHEIPNYKQSANTLDDANRKRRNHDGKTVASASVETSAISNDSTKTMPTKQSAADKDHEGNFAKMLIKQEILEDQQESSGSSPSGIINERSSRIRNIKAPTRKAQLVEKNHSNSDKQGDKDERGEKSYQYPKKERNRDHITLIDEMQKTRKNKSNTRSRIHMPVDSILKRAMDGELGIKTERTSDGKLALRGPNKDSLVTLDLAGKNADDNRVKDDEGEINSELLPSQIEPDKSDRSHSVDRIHLQSKAPLKNEYPISERVSDRLNKLSYNLDRYFNDGFLQEIEDKSKLDGDKNQGAEPAQPQPQPSNVNSKKSTRANPPPDKDENDRDLDVDVDIDGKREKDDDDEKEDEDNGAGKAGGKSGSKSVSKVAQKNGDKPRKVTMKGKKVQKKKKSDAKSTVVKQVLSKKEKSEADSNSEPANLDPVESESLETPIGPDGETSETPKTNAKKTKSESKISTSYKRGKKTTGNKFYEEPDWR